MFQRKRLSAAFEYLTTPEEWHWFGPMAARGVMHVGLDGWPLFPNRRRVTYPDLWRKCAGRALEKLRDGDWMAEGISPQYGPRPVPIDTDLWHYLRLVDRAEEAEGVGFHFVALTVSCLEAKAAMVPHTEKADLRRQLTAWIRAQAVSSHVPLLRDEQLAMAREVFGGCVITDNMYRDCRRAAGLPEDAVQRGRPKVKGSDF